MSRCAKSKVQKDSYLPTALFALRYYASLLFVVNNRTKSQVKVEVKVKKKERKKKGNGQGAMGK